LLTFLLAAHPGIATVGELKATAMGDIATYHCSCGSLLTQCSFWLQLQKRMRDLGGELSLEDFGTHYQRGPTAFRKLIALAVWPSSVSWMSGLGIAITPGFRARLDRVSEQNCKLMAAVTEIQHGRVFLDGSKDPERLSQFLDCLGDKVKVIHLIRDGRGVTNSYMKHYDVGMRTAAHELVRTTRACERVMRRVPSGHGLTLKYEDLCRAPQESLARIFSLCGLEPDPQVRRTEPSEFHIMGNSMRLEFGKPIKIDEKWRVALKEQHLHEFEQAAGALNRQHGYA
jgi:hypothetical protein